MDDPTTSFRTVRCLGNIHQFSHGRLSGRAAFVLAFALVCVIGQAVVQAQQPKWIWSPKSGGMAAGASEGECYFRTKFTLIKPEQAEIQFTAGDEYELYINNRLVSKGESYGSVSKVDAISAMRPGVNLVAVKVRHTDSDKPGLAMKIRIKEEGETRWRSLTTNSTWKTRKQLISAWKQNGYNDMGWLNAKELADATVLSKKPVAKAAQPAEPAPVARTKPEVASPKAQVTANVASAKAEAVEPAQMPVSNPAASKPAAKPANTFANRFELGAEFTVQQVLEEKQTGSIVAMEFNEFGKLLFSREGGSLMVADLGLPAGSPGRVRVLCDKVKSCGGILPLNGDVYVTGDGPSGLALYRLSDANGDGKMEPTKALFKFTGKVGGHGPHGMRLGPDAMIYMVLGNGSQVDKPISETSAYRHVYEGSVVKRYEDPSGHAAGIKAPGGTVIRCSLDGKKIETFAGGLRNASDLVFDHNGDMFVHDSDNPADIGTPWYRPSMLFHVSAGSELGWRSGSAKFPTWFVDGTAPVCEAGSASPAGAVVYQHLQFPARYHDAIFSANRATGEITAMQVENSGAGFTGSIETFMRGKSFDATDLAVGEDGSLYVATGSRGSSGGLYRVVWNGDVPENILNFDSDLAKVIRHPQPNSTWARQNIAQLKITLGREWANSIRGVITEKRNPARFRIRAMQLMVLYGPAPDEAMLNGLAKEDDPEIRAQVARLCAATGIKRNQMVLQGLLSDAEPIVRRVAAEAMLTMGVESDLELLSAMLSSEDRTEAAVARRLLERIPSDQWKDEILTTDDKRLFIQGAVALAVADPSVENAYAVLARGSSFMDGFVNDVDFADMLRAMQLSLKQSDVDPTRIPGFATRIANEFPSGNTRINQELSRLLGYLKSGELEGRLETYFEDADVEEVEKIHTAFQLQAVGADLTDSETLAVVRYLESVRPRTDVGDSYDGYVKRAIVDCAAHLSVEQAYEVLGSPKQYPTALISAFYHLPAELDESTFQQLIEIDQTFAKSDDEQSSQVRLGVIALLAQCGDEPSMEYLRKMWQIEPQRRSDIAIGLAQKPDGENWSYLVSTLPLLDNTSGPEVLSGLLRVARKPRDPRHFRDLIGAAEKLDKVSSRAAIRLLEHWAGESVAEKADNDRTKIASWKKWCEENFAPAAAATTASEAPETERF